MPNKQLTAKVRLNTKDAERSIDRLVKKLDKLNNITNKAANAGNQNQYYAKTQRQVDSITTKVKSWANAQKQVTSSVKGTNSALSAVGSKLKWLASTYLGVMGAKAVTSTTDVLVGAQNRLDYVAPGQFGAAMDKMYATSQGSRTSYQDMISNVSKTMTLAGNAFDNNIDNAIRFQEVMAKAYAVGGASAAEMSSSMYQLTQALGSGILQGDELRSVREGAPLAYKAIEQFAQGVLKTDVSLKELAADGLITSEMVVAAVMDMGAGIDKAFANTRQTFGQTLDQIKNSALYAFQPVMEMLTDALNKAIDNGMIQKFESFFTFVSKGIMIVFTIISNVVTWIADNWDWLWRAISTGVILIGTIMAIVLFPKFIGWISYIQATAMYYIMLAQVAIASAINTAKWWLIANWQMALIIAVIVAIIVAVIWLADSFEDACGMIVGIITAAISVIWNLFVMLVTLIVQEAIRPLLLAWDTFANVFGNLFNDPIAAIIYAFEGLQQSVLGILRTIANGIDAIFGSNLAEAVNGWSSSLKGKADALANKYGTGSYSQKSNAVESVNNLLSGLQTKISWNTGNAYNTGYKLGNSAGTWISDKVSGLGIDKLGKKLGLDFSNMTTPFPSTGVGSAYTPDMEKLLGGIGDDTGKIADSMDLTREDLEYLRRIADMEWKKEFTTAEIKIDMTNNNQVNGESDLDGIVTKLADKLYEEMNVLANGVYSY